MTPSYYRRGELKKIISPSYYRRGELKKIITLSYYKRGELKNNYSELLQKRSVTSITWLYVIIINSSL